TSRRSTSESNVRPAGAAPMETTGVPENCPVCDRVLYPVARLRPAPSLTRAARLLLWTGALLSAVAYWGGRAAIRAVMWVPMWVLSVLWLPFALVPALAVGAVAWGFPRVARVSCQGCGWRGRVELGRPVTGGGEGSGPKPLPPAGPAPAPGVAGAVG